MAIFTAAARWSAFQAISRQSKDDCLASERWKWCFRQKMCGSSPESVENDRVTQKKAQIRAGNAGKWHPLFSSGLVQCWVSSPWWKSEKCENRMYYKDIRPVLYFLGWYFLNKAMIDKGAVNGDAVSTKLWRVVSWMSKVPTVLTNQQSPVQICAQYCICWGDIFCTKPWLIKVPYTVIPSPQCYGELWAEWVRSLLY